jgi:PBP1b-binding outer membrane lipoprotein LpoB
LIQLLLAAFLASCSSNPGAPTEAEARAAVEREIEDFSQGCIKLVDFHKTGEKMMESVVLVNATARIEFLEDCNWPMDTVVVALKVVPGATPNVRKGEQRTAHLTLQFHKTDRGWKATHE